MSIGNLPIACFLAEANQWPEDAGAYLATGMNAI